jgi:hypothetical protein
MEISVTKLDAAKRQLETAILLYFSEKDPVSIHTLCCAAYEVIHALNKKRNSPMGPNDLMLKDLDQYLGSKADRRQFHECMNEARNFFKHANSDPDAVQTLDTRFTEALLIDAVQKYARLIGECPPTMALYFVWFLTQHPLEAGQEIMQHSLRTTLERALKAMSKDRRTFFADFSPIMKSIPL